MSEKQMPRSQTASGQGLRVELIGVKLEEDVSKKRRGEIQILMTQLIVSGFRRGRPRKVKQENFHAA